MKIVLAGTRAIPDAYRETFFKGVGLIHCYDVEDRIGTTRQFVYHFNCIRASRERKSKIILQLGYTSSTIRSWLFSRAAILVGFGAGGLLHWLFSRGLWLPANPGAKCAARDVRRVFFNLVHDRGGTGDSGRYTRIHTHYHRRMEPEAIQLNIGRLSIQRPVLPQAPGVVLRAGPSSAYSLYGKRLLDVALALLLLLLLCWIIPVLFVLICLSSPGPLFFVQKRTGQGGKIFSCIKFRTMRRSSDCDIQQARNDDHRITPIGRILRATHIDELPQLVNVLLNNMSLVGPRPHMLYHDRLFSALLPQYPQRNAVKPGITGLAQAAGYHGATPDFFSISHRTRLDLFYVRHLSAGLDAKILLRTLLIFPAKILKHAHAQTR